MSPALTVQRYTYHERIMHWLTALTYGYGLLTGLAFYSPHLFWIAQVLGSGATSRYWHPINGVSFLVVAVWMLHSVWRPRWHGDHRCGPALARQGEKITSRIERIRSRHKIASMPGKSCFTG